MQAAAQTADAVIIGGGVIGCATAWELARRGLEVVVIERGQPGRGASWAAAGMLSPLAESRRPGPFLDLALAGLDRFHSFVGALHEATGVDVEYRKSGKLQLALDAAQAEQLTLQHAWQREAGFAVELLDGAEARRWEPALSPAVQTALYMPYDHQVESRRLARALWSAAARAGVHFHLGVPAAGIVCDTQAAAAPARVAHRSAEGAGRVRGVALANGDVLHAGAVLIAAGCWSGQLGGLPRPLPVVPVRGQMAALETVPPLLERVVLTPGCYLIPRAGGRLLVGATVEQAGFRCHPTPAGIRGLLDYSMEAVPELAAAPLVEIWAGLRPGTPDDLPILGPDPDVRGLYYATGHFRNGILLAAITAELLADAIMGAQPALPLSAFGPGRFRGGETR
ncbi:MAG: glycine oxidase ThiO [Gemmatimonadetes bacterium]|nr:glycine oxidase ThiO [Gemmatimonadota bacterium]